MGKVNFLLNVHMEDYLSGNDNSIDSGRELMNEDLDADDKFINAAMEDLEKYTSIADNIAYEISQNEVNISNLVGSPRPETIVSSTGEFLGKISGDVSPSIDKGDDVSAIIPLEICDQNNRLCQNVAGQLGYSGPDGLDKMKSDLGITYNPVSMESARLSPLHAYRIHTEGLKEILSIMAKKIKDFIRMLIESIKKFFSMAASIFKRTEKDIKDQEKNLSKGKFDVKDPSVASGNTKLYAKSDVINVVESNDERLSGLSEVVKKFTGEVKDDLTLDGLVKVVKEIILRPAGNADDLKAEIIAYINANLTDKKLQERRNTVVDIKEIAEEIEFFTKYKNNVTRIDGGNERREFKDLVNNFYDEEEMKMKFKFFFGGSTSRSKGNLEFYLKVLSGSDFRDLGDIKDAVIGSPYWGRYNSLNDDVGEISMCPVDTGDSESFFDSYYIIKAKKADKMASKHNYVIIGEEVKKLDDPNGISNDAYKRVFGGSSMEDFKEPIIYLVGDGIKSFADFAKMVIDNRSVLERETKKTLEEFEKSNFYNVSNTSLQYSAFPFGYDKRNDPEVNEAMYENVRMLCKIYYNSTKYFLKVPIVVKKAIDYYRSVINSELFIKVK